MNPSSVQHAALRVLLDEIDPLLLQTASTVDVLRTVQAELHADLATLGTLVQRCIDAQPALLETGRRLGASAARIEAALQTQSEGMGAAPLRHVADRLWPACVAAALLSSALLACGIWVATGPLREQARLGRALQAAWPALDAGTRALVHPLLGRP